MSRRKAQSVEDPNEQFPDPFSPIPNATVVMAEPSGATTDQANPAAKRLTAHDVIDPDRWYGPYELEELLGIPRNITKAAQSRTEGPRAFSQYRVGGARSDEKSNRGGDILDWIEREHIRYSPTDSAIALHEAKSRRAAAISDPTPKPKPSIIDRAIDTIADRQAARAADEATWRERAWREYAAILSRADAPQPNDEQSLQELLKELEIPADEARNDLRLVKRARRCAELHAGMAAAHEASIEARRKLAEVTARHKRELEEANRANLHASAEHTECSRAASELTSMVKQRPELFDTSSYPPRVHGT